MLKFIGAVFSYSLLVIVILVLSHIIEIKGVTLSKHVEHSLDWLGDMNPKKITRTISGELQNQYKKIDSIGNEAPHEDVSVTDKKQLEHVIERSKHR